MPGGDPCPALLLELGQGADVVNPPLLAESDHGLGPELLGPTSVKGAHQQVGVDAAQGVLHVRAALVDLGHATVGLVLGVHRDHAARPFVGDVRRVAPSGTK
jgi:hypothetical protein